MVNVIMDQCTFGIHYSLLNRVELLRDIKTGLARFEHLDHSAQMAIGTFQPGDQGGVGCMKMGLCHMKEAIPLGWI